MNIHLYIGSECFLMSLHKWKDENAVSPVIGVILMVAMTVVLSGFVYMWATQLAETKDKAMTYYLFDLTLDSENDEILLELRSGPLVSSEYFELNIDGTNSPIPVQLLIAGDIILIESPVDMIFGQTYNIKIINTESVIWDEDYIAKAI